MASLDLEKNPGLFQQKNDVVSTKIDLIALSVKICSTKNKGRFNKKAFLKQTNMPIWNNKTK